MERLRWVSVGLALWPEVVGKEEILVADVLAALVTTTARAGRTHDEIARLVERSVDQRFERAIAGLTLADLLIEARSAHRSQAANYVI